MEWKGRQGRGRKVGHERERKGKMTHPDFTWIDATNTLNRDNSIAQLSHRRDRP